MTTSITRHHSPCDTHNLYDVIFDGETIETLVTHDPNYVESWITDIERIHYHRRSSLIVGLDVEWRPSLNRNYHNPVATLQLCVGHRCLIYQLIHTDSIPYALEEFLNAEYTFVGVGVDSDLRKLNADYNIGNNTNSVDLRTLAVIEYGLSEYQNAGLKKLAHDVLGKEVVKPRRVTMSRWDDLHLSLDQVKYACLDAFISFEIGRVLHAFR
ncbi:Polynucleotidyl transferase [Abeliophyllum distichum]|uniref:Polynucleotidyl transferase n=1 Tax=Abeliophyllum distichum TaxID=126358 RepID=A0ABD1QY52_9LAMI